MGENRSVQLENESTIEYETIFGRFWFGTNFPLSLAIIGGNSIALVVFLRKTFRVKKSNYLLVNLTLADLLVGFASLFLSISVWAFNFSFDAFYEKKTILLPMVLSFVSQASIYTLSVISLERVLAVFWPFHHRLAKRCHYFTAIALVWILAALELPEHIFEPSTQTTKEKVMYFLSYYFVVVASLLTIFISYFSIWIKMKFFTKFRNCRTIQENSKLTKTLFIVTVVSLGTWLPKLTMDWVSMINNVTYSEQSIYLRILLIALLLSNSFLNLVVYSFRMPEFRREIRQIFCQCR